LILILKTAIFAYLFVSVLFTPIIFLMVSDSINPNISVDCVVFGYDFKHLNVLLVERTLIGVNNETIFSDYSLAGNHIYEDEDIDGAASRILEDLTGFKKVYLKQFQSFAHPDRLKKIRDQKWLRSIGYNSQNRVITVGYYALLNCKEVTIHPGNRIVKWTPVEKVKKLAFDHNEILSNALDDLRLKMRTSPIGYELLPKKFTLSQLQKLYEVIYDTRIDKRNFRKKIAKLNYIVPLNEKQKGVAHKPAQLYMYSQEVFEITKREFFDITI